MSDITTAHDFEAQVDLADAQLHATAKLTVIFDHVSREWREIDDNEINLTVIPFGSSDEEDMEFSSLDKSSQLTLYRAIGKKIDEATPTAAESEWERNQKPEDRD